MIRSERRRTLERLGYGAMTDELQSARGGTEVPLQ